MDDAPSPLRSRSPLRALRRGTPPPVDPDRHAALLRDLDATLVMVRAHLHEVSRHPGAPTDPLDRSMQGLELARLLVRALGGEAEDGEGRITEALSLVLDLLRPSWPPDVEVQVAVDAGVPPVEVPPLALQRALLHLIQDAAAALEASGGGTLQIRLDRVRGGAARLVLAVEAPVPESCDETRPGAAVARTLLEPHGGRLLLSPGEPDGWIHTALLPVEHGTGR